MTNRDIRTGKYTRKSKLAFFTIIFAVGLIIAHATYTSSALQNELTADIPTPQIATVVYADSTIEAKVEELKQKLVEEMIACENPRGIPAWYDNNSSGTLSKRDAISYGPLAYKIPTLQDHYKTLYGKTPSDVEAATFAMNDEVKPFVIKVWLEIPGSINHWTCATPEMKRRVEDIRFLTV